MCARIVAVLETDPNDKETATKIAVLDPLRGANGENSIMASLGSYLLEFMKDKNADERPIIKAIMNCMLDLRYILPPVYNFDPKFFVINKETL